MKRVVALVLGILIIIQANVKISAIESDIYALSEQVKTVYSGVPEGGMTVKNLNFTDVLPDNPAKEAIIRSGALNLIKGDGRNYMPEDAVTNQEALAIIIRAIGGERQALELGTSLTAQMPEDSPLSEVWSLGYLALAQSIELITPLEYADATMADQTLIDPENGFFREGAATRENVAAWIYRSVLSIASQTSFVQPESIQALLGYSDWEEIAADKALAVDAVTMNNIMSADVLGRFNPSGSVSRADMAQILKNMEDVYLPVFGLEKKNGTIAAIRDEQIMKNGEAGIFRNVYIRTADGEIEVVQYELRADSSNNLTDNDVVVFKDGNVGGISVLTEGDTVEYIVRRQTSTALYVQVVKDVSVTEISGILYKVSTENKIITLTDYSGKTFDYVVAEQLVAPEGGVDSLLVDGKRQSVATLPIGDIVKLTLSDNVVTGVTYVGQAAKSNEMQAIVIENDPAFGTMTILDSKGVVSVKKYYENDMKVKKEQYYSLGDDLGYITEIFPHFKYDKRETEISDVEAGDIVFLRFSSDDADVIVNVSAATNYTMRYGKIKQLTNLGDYSEMLVEYENKQTAVFEFSNSIFVTKAGRPIELSAVIVGDWVKILVNEAIVSAGHVMETVKELCVEGEGHLISTIIKGNLAGLDSIQNQITIQNSQELTKNGWTNYQNLSKYSIASNDIEYYDGNKQISLDYAVKYFKRSDAVVYVAIENNYAGARVKKITFRKGRDELLSPDTVVLANGTGGFNMFGEMDDLLTDAGTIVRRYGRLVDGTDIMPSDYVRVSLNGDKTAAIVDITDMPSVSDISIARGRVLSVDENRSFKVQSMSILSGVNWVYTPVQREFSIDYDTRFITENGVTNMEGFLGYTEESVIYSVFNIVVDGSRAAYVVDAPYASSAVKGTIYEITETEMLIKDASFYDNDTGLWHRISDTNNTLIVSMQMNTIFGKNNKITTAESFEVGDTVCVFTDVLPDPMLPGTAVTGYIVLAEK